MIAQRPSLRFGSVVGRRIESEHKNTKYATTRGFMFAGPAATCAKQRRKQNFALVDADRQWFINNWHSRHLYADLLSHLMLATAVNNSSIAHKHSKIYQYGLEDLFDEHAELGQQLALWDKERAAIQAKPMTITSALQMCIAYIKNVLKVGCVYSLPSALLRRAMTVVDVAPTPQPEQIYDAMKVDGEWNFDDSVSVEFFQVVAPRREQQVHLRAAHVARDSAAIMVEILELLGRTGSSYRLRHGKHGSVAVDPCQWCCLDNFKLFSQNLVVWRMLPGELELNIAEDISRNLAPPVLRMNDPDDLLALAPLRDFDDELSLVELHAMVLSSSSAASSSSTIAPTLEIAQAFADGLAVEHPDKKRRITLVKSLVEKRMFAESGNYENSFTIDGFDCFVAKGLENAGVLVSRLSEFGDTEYAVALSQVRTSATMIVDYPKLVSRCSVGQASIRHLSKLELLRYLMRNDWVPGDGAPLMKEGPRFFYIPNLLKSKSYWLCMACSEFIFAKPGLIESICQQSTHFYYECLLQCADLTHLREKGNPLLLTDDEFKRVRVVQNSS
jgi:hypothetical protein